MNKNALQSVIQNWQTINGSYSIKHQVVISVANTKLPSVEDSIETALAAQDFAQANSVIDYIRNL